MQRISTLPPQPPQKELEIPGVKELSEGRRALRKNPFQGKMWIFSEATQWIYLLLKGGDGGCGEVTFEIQERSQVVFKVIKRSDIQILLKDLKG